MALDFESIGRVTTRFVKGQRTPFCHFLADVITEEKEFSLPFLVRIT